MKGIKRFRKRINNPDLIESETIRNNFNYLLDEIEMLTLENKELKEDMGDNYFIKEVIRLREINKNLRNSRNTLLKKISDLEKNIINMVNNEEVEISKNELVK